MPKEHSISVVDENNRIIAHFFYFDGEPAAVVKEGYKVIFNGETLHAVSKETNREDKETNI